MPKGSAYSWTDAMHIFCCNRRDMLRRDLQVAFNRRFRTDRSYECIRNFCKRNGYHTGRDGRFEKGNVSHNKGKAGWSAPGTEATRFRKGNTPTNTHPLGTVQKTTGRPHKNDPGYWRVKTGEPNHWTFQHRLIWEEANGPMPAGHALIFKDGDEDNVTLDNIALVTRGELAILNKKFNWKGTHPRHRESVLLMARLQYVTGRLSRGESLDTTENSLRALADAHGINYATVSARIANKGWSVEKALSTPVNQSSATA